MYYSNMKPEVLIHFNTLVFLPLCNPQVLEEIAICGLVYTNSDTEETTVTHCVINWASTTAKFYSQHTNHFKEEEGSILFPLQLFQDDKMQFGCNGGLHYRGNIGGSSRDVTIGGKMAAAGSATQFGARWTEPPPFSVSWGTVAFSAEDTPTHSGHGTYVYRLSPAGDLCAIVMNKARASRTKVNFFSPLNQVGISVNVYQQPDQSWVGRWVVTTGVFFIQ